MLFEWLDVKEKNMGEKMCEVRNRMNSWARPGCRICGAKEGRSRSGCGNYRLRFHTSSGKFCEALHRSEARGCATFMSVLR